MPDTQPSSVLAGLAAVLGPGGLLTGTTDTARYTTDWRDLRHGVPLAVARPADTATLAALVRLCVARGIAMVPQGGNTSMVVGATPDTSGHQLVVCLERMRRVRGVDALDMTMTVEAGLPLRAAQLAAEAAGCQLPLSIASEGSATIGGVLATNAGGTLTLRHGNARDLMLGLEVVLPDGQVWDGLRQLRKDNTGYALRHLFCGSEGTLGFITAAVLRLVPRAVETIAAFCAVPSPAAALALFARARRHDAGVLAAFEFMSGAGLDLVLLHIEGASFPLAAPAPGYALIECAVTRPGAALRESLESVLEAALEAGEITDAAIAESEAQRAAFWRLREEHGEAQKRAGASVKNDVSVPVSRMADFIERATAVCAALVPGVRAVPFGHVGDGNVHFNLLTPQRMEGAAFLARGDDLLHAVGEVVAAFGGSFAAEHGVGSLKAGLMPVWRGGAEITVMRRIKTALDPAGLMNPGVLLPPDDFTSGTG